MKRIHRAFVLALAAVTTGAGLAPRAALAADHHAPSAQEADQDASKYQDYLKTKLKSLQNEADKLDSRLQREGRLAHEQEKRDLAELQGRIDELSKRLDATRATATREAREQRKGVEKRLETLRKDLEKLEKDLKR